MDNKIPGSDPRKPYGTPIPPRPELGSILPPDFTSSPLHPMDTLNPEHQPQAQQSQPVITAEQLVTPGPPPTRPWEQPAGRAGTAGTLPGQTPIKKRPRRKFIVMTALVLALVISGAAFFAAPLFNKNSNGSTGDASVADLAKQGKLTAAVVAKLNVRTYLQNTMTAMAAQQTQHLIQEVATMIAANTRPENFLTLDLSDTTYNYKTKALYILTQHEQSEAVPNPFYTTCFNGQTYSYTPIGAQQAWKADAAYSGCDPLQAAMTRAIADGTNTGGLSAEQAKTFVDAIFNTTPKDVMKVTSATLTTHNNRQYIKLRAQLKAVDVGAADQPNWQGQTFVANAFKKTGVKNWPYYADGVDSAGRGITMYVDPATGLPAYAEYLTDTGIEVKTGKAQPVSNDNRYRLIRVQYEFGGAVPKASVSQLPNAIAISWPAENR